MLINLKPYAYFLLSTWYHIFYSLFLFIYLFETKLVFKINIKSFPDNKKPQRSLPSMK